MQPVSLNGASEGRCFCFFLGGRGGHACGGIKVQEYSTPYYRTYSVELGNYGSDEDNRG